MRKLLVSAIVAIGLVLSVVLHECLHMLLHLGHIQRIELLPGNGNIFQVVATTPVGYNVMIEELFAYLVTVVVLLATVYIAASVWYAK